MYRLSRNFCIYEAKYIKLSILFRFALVRDCGDVRRREERPQWVQWLVFPAGYSFFNN
jgi:hypothetical protein